MEEPKTYELRTLRDIFEQVPPERLEDCLRELTVAMELARAVATLTEFAYEREGAPIEPIRWPEPFIWIDDGKGEMGVRLTDGTGNTATFMVRDTPVDT